MKKHNQSETQKNVSLVRSTSSTLHLRLGAIHEMLEDLTSSPSSHDMMELAMAVATRLQMKSQGG